MKRVFGILLFVVGYVSVMSAAGLTPLQKQLLSRSSQDLLELAWSSSSVNEVNDTTLECLAIVTHRYEKNATIDEKRCTVKAWLSLWSVYFYNFFDYSKCLNCLEKAQSINRETGDLMPTIDRNYAMVYQTIAEQTNDKALKRKAMESYKTALDIAFKKRDENSIDGIFQDMPNVAYSADAFDEIAGEWARYSAYPVSKGNMVRQFNTDLYEGLTALSKGRTEEALGEFTHMREMCEENGSIPRKLYTAITYQVECLEKLNRTHEAIERALEAQEIAQATGNKDMRLDIMSVLARLYGRSGNNSLRTKYREGYFDLKDSLITSQQMASLGKVAFQQQLDAANSELNALQTSRDRIKHIFVVVACVAAVILLALILLLRSYRRLRHSHRELYQKNMQLQQAEQRNKAQRQQQVIEPIEEAEPDAPATEKYKNSRLSDDEKQRISARLRHILENEDVIYDADFNIENLASMCDSKYKYVSQVIHEEYDCNFNTLLNHYRIVEACRRMNDAEKYGNITIEGISTSVGFRSRSTFTSAFRRETGLKPSEWLSIARDKKNQPK